MGAYLTDDTMLADYGVEVGFDDNLHYFSSRGPQGQPQGCLAQTCEVGYALANGEFEVRIDPATVGAHSAILRLDDPTTRGIDYQSMNTVIVPHAFTADNNFSVSESGTVDRAQTLHYFFEVPAGTPAFKVDLAAPDGVGHIRFLRWTPWALGADSNAVSNCYINPALACSTGSGTSRTVQDPLPGVREVTVDACRNSAADDAAFTLTASVLGASVSPDPDVIAEAAIGTPVARSYEITNIFGAFTGRAVGTAMGSAVVETKTIAHHEVQEFEVEVPAGASSLRATIGNPSDPAADLDLFAIRLNGTAGGQSADGDSEESITVANPAAGTWTIVVDGFSVPAGTSTYEYIDVFFTTAPMGSISVTDANALRAAGASWTVPGTVTANVAPADGRVLYGNVEVRTDANVLVGRGDVIVESVLAP